MKKIDIKVKGMSCTGCENRICNALKNIEDIDSVKASYQSGIVTLTSQKELDKDTIIAKIEDIGFEIVED